ncbi:MAG: hydrolase [Pelistega sp.]|nr:hydrolase [Pelistega sp.]
MNLEFHPPFWLPEGQSQTIIGSKLARYPRIQFTRQRIATDDGDFIDLDWNIPVAEPVSTFTGHAFVLFHGLEGSSQSHYAQSLCHDFRSRGWAVVVAHFRGCSGEPNRLARSYFSGDTKDVAIVMNALLARLPHARWHAAGVSMGGNVLLKYLAEQGEQARFLHAAASVSTPTDLLATGLQLGKGFFGRFVYTPYFLTTMKPKMREKAKQFPDLIDIQGIEAAKTLQEFDDRYTGPIHGFKDAVDYWTRCSSKPELMHIRIPTLILNAKNDPFVPRESLPTIHDVSSSVLLHQPEHGGHVGFSQGTFPHKLGWLSERLNRFFGGFV